MIRDFFLTCESLTPDDSLELQPFIDQLAFDANGLLPVITQDSQSREVLMLAWMNKVALHKTLLHQRMFYWSRSRKALWEKGKTSGHYQYVKSIRFDCDGDAILCQVKQVGAACHTERKSCFYFEADTIHKTLSITTTAPNKGTE